MTAISRFENGMYNFLWEKNKKKKKKKFRKKNGKKKKFFIYFFFFFMGGGGGGWEGGGGWFDGTESNSMASVYVWCVSSAIFQFPYVGNLSAEPKVWRGKKKKIEKRFTYRII